MMYYYVRIEFTGDLPQPWIFKKLILQKLSNKSELNEVQKCNNMV